MWNIFKHRQNSLPQSKDRSDEYNQKNLQQLRLQFEEKLKQLTKQINKSQKIFIQSYRVDPKEEALSCTFQEMMASLEGLISIIGVLKAEYEQVQGQINEYNQIKHMVSNHHSIVNSIQETHSNQVAQIYEDKRNSENELNQKILKLQGENKILQINLNKLQNQFLQCKEQITNLQSQNNKIKNENKKLQLNLQELYEKYQQIITEGRDMEAKKIVNMQNIKIDYIFYYNKLRERIIGFLQIKDLLNLKNINKFYRITLRKEESKHIYNYFKRKTKIFQLNQIKNTRFYQKIYELFPLENIKVCAFKYLYFKIKPATYILPYLQDEQLEVSKIQNQFKQQRQNHSNKFNWRQIFSSDKHSKLQKKQQNRFSLGNLKNQEEYQRVESRLQVIFRNIFPIKMPYDLKYFCETMQKQLQELKIVMSQYKTFKAGQMEWTAQLHCLAKYMYIQISQLYNLLQVIFGELVNKNKELISIRESYQYLKENEIVLRNLIQNISNDKSNIEKRYLMIQNQILKKNLEKQAISNKYELLLTDYQQIKNRYQSIQSEHDHFRKVIEKSHEERKIIDFNLNKVRQQLQTLEKYSCRSRRASFASVSSEDHILSNETFNL